MIADIKAGNCPDQSTAREADRFIMNGRVDILYTYPESSIIGKIAKFGKESVKNCKP